MAARHDDARVRRHAGQELDVGLARDGIADGKVELAGGELAHDLLRAADEDVERDLEMPLGHVGHQARDHRAAEAFHQADGGMAAHRAAQFRQALQRPRMVVLPALDIGDQDAAGFGEAEPARQALEQVRAVLGLELEDLAVHRGGRHVELHRGPSNRSDLGDQAQPGGGGRDQRHDVIRADAAGSGHGAPHRPAVLLDNGPVGGEPLLDVEDQFSELLVAEIVEDRAAGAVGQVLASAPASSRGPCALPRTRTSRPWRSLLRRGRRGPPYPSAGAPVSTPSNRGKHSKK